MENDCNLSDNRPIDPELHMANLPEKTRGNSFDLIGGNITSNELNLLSATAGRSTPQDELGKLDEQINTHYRYKEEQSLLSAVFDSVWRGDDNSLSELEELRRRGLEAKKNNDQLELAEVKKLAAEKISTDKLNLEFQSNLSNYSSMFVTTASLFLIGRGKGVNASTSLGSAWTSPWLGRTATATAFGLDQARVGDNFSTQILDGTIGAGKGLALRGTLGLMGRYQMAAPVQGVVLGSSSRALENLSQRRTYIDSQTGSLDIRGGLERSIGDTLSPGALAMDALLFGSAHKLSSSLGRMNGGLLDRNPLLRTVTMSSSFGFTRGAGMELQNEWKSGELTDFSQLPARSLNVMKAGLTHAFVDGLAGVPGGLQARTIQRQIASAERVAAEKSVTPVETTAQNTAGSRYRSDIVLENGTRVITKHDGTTVTIDRAGKVTLKEPIREPASARETIAKVQETVEPTRTLSERAKPPDYSHLPIEQRPLNVVHGGKEVAASQMSNFAHTPFTLHGRTFASVEAFYVFLKWSGNPVKQAEAQGLHGVEAKRHGRAASPEIIEYNGRRIEPGSQEHHALIKEAIKAKLEQHPELARDFATTHPRPIVHELGHPESRSTKLPARDFSRILSEVRQEVVDGRLIPRENRALENSQPVDSLLRTLKGQRRIEDNHALEQYITAFEGYTQPVKRVIATGGDSIVMEMANGNVLKISNRNIAEPLGRRDFDLPLIEKGTRLSRWGQPVSYIVQPMAQTPVSEVAGRQFRASLIDKGYFMADGGVNQIGMYNGKPYLLDPFAVQKLPDR